MLSADLNSLLHLVICFGVPDFDGRPIIYQVFILYYLVLLNENTCHICSDVVEVEVRALV